mgnify:CR=1 FL=1
MNVPIGVCNGDSGGPLTYYNGTHTGDFLKILIFHLRIDIMYFRQCLNICKSGALPIILVRKDQE